MDYSTSKDYFIIRVRYYASEYLMKKQHEQGSHPKQQWERAEQINKLYWDFITFVTKKEHEWWLLEYPHWAKECAIEEMEDNFGIVISDREGNYVFLIPKRHTHIIDWFKTNIDKYKLPNKILTKLQGISFIGSRHSYMDLKWHRNEATRIKNEKDENGRRKKS